MSSRGLKVMFYLVLLVAVVGVTIQPANGQDLKGFSRPRTVTRAISTLTVPSGQKTVITGNVTRVEGDTLSVCDRKGNETVVVLDPETKIETHRRGIFRWSEKLDREALMIGLRVQVKGRGNDAGQLTAKWIRFHDSDLRAETQIETRAVPIEAEQLRQGEQIEETHGVATTALKNAKTAQDSADRAQSTADVAKSDAATAQTTAMAAHNKIAAIDDFETTESLTVNFKAGSAILTPDAKAKLDEFAAKTLSAKGYLIEVSGFASKEGGLYYNHELSGRRAEAVMDYLVGVSNVPLRRIAGPHSGGIMNPVADNSTRVGREQNRRVEVKMLVSKGLTASEPVTARAKD